MNKDNRYTNGAKPFSEPKHLPIFHPLGSRTRGGGRTTTTTTTTTTKDYDKPLTDYYYFVIEPFDLPTTAVFRFQKFPLSAGVAECISAGLQVPLTLNDFKTTISGSWSSTRQQAAHCDSTVGPVCDIQALQARFKTGRLKTPKTLLLGTVSGAGVVD